MVRPGKQQVDGEGSPRSVTTHLTTSERSWMEQAGSERREVMEFSREGERLFIFFCIFLQISATIVSRKHLL